MTSNSQIYLKVTKSLTIYIQRKGDKILSICPPNRILKKKKTKQKLLQYHTREIDGRVELTIEIDVIHES